MLLLLYRAKDSYSDVISHKKIPYVLCAECAHCSLQANMWHALRSSSFPLNLHMYGDLWTSYKYMGINNYLFLQETVFRNKRRQQASYKPMKKLIQHLKHVICVRKRAMKRNTNFSIYNPPTIHILLYSFVTRQRGLVQHHHQLKHS
jgi:hypothetical protein